MSVTIGIVSPGAMGSALGRAWQRGGARVVATTAGRSPRTARLAEAAGLELLADLDAVVGTASIVVSIGPPDRAVDLAGQIAAAARRTGRTPLVADLNAVAPATVARIQDALPGLDFVDGAISGPPPDGASRTIVYLSGRAADRLAELPAPGIAARVVGDRPGQASAVKMCTASLYKGFTGLLVQALLTAQAHGCVDVVLADLREEFDGIDEWAGRQLARAASKSGRWVGEMREIAATQGAAGGRPELFEAMAQVWAMVAATPLARPAPEDVVGDRPLGDVLADLVPLDPHPA